MRLWPFKRKEHTEKEPESPEELSQRIREIAKHIRGLIIAIDLEGTLVCPMTRAKRGGADELLSSLAQHNTVILWTSATRYRAAEIIRSAKLEMPKQVKTETREAYQEELTKHDIIPEPLSNSHAWAMRIIEQRTEWIRRGQHPGDKNFTDQDYDTALIYTGNIKIPSILGIDVLLDDKKERHDEGCRQLGYHEDPEKIIAVSPFYCFDGYMFETGLLQAIKQLKEWTKDNKN